jgi:hypothetical protein
MVNPHCPEPYPTSLRPPRLDWKDKWQMFKMSRDEGVKEHLKTLVAMEEEMYR